MDSSNTATTGKPCFLQDNDDDDALASFAADMEPGISGHHFFSRPLFSRSFRTLSAVAGSRPSHFLDSCFLCRKPLGKDADIFMYRGDTPFCSEECRQEQIETDEAKEKKWRRTSSAAMKALRKKDQRRRRSASPNKSSPPPDYPFRAGTVAAA